jgi:hypothetical protein
MSARTLVIAGLSVASLGVAAGWQDADVFAKRGIYVKTERGVAELTTYVESKSLFDTPEVKAYRYVLPLTLRPPTAKVVLSFVINMPGNGAEPWVAASQLLFLVGRQIEDGRRNNYALTTRISRLRPSVYVVQSPQFQGGWLEETYARLAGADAPHRPEAFITLLVQDSNGQPRKLYPVKVFGD